MVYPRFTLLCYSTLGFPWDDFAVFLRETVAKCGGSAEKGVSSPRRPDPELLGSWRLVRKRSEGEVLS